MWNDKFRLWCKNKNEWESNDWAILPNGSLAEIRNNRLIPISNKTHILIKYIGLRDKNGKEIYEGDIVKRERYTSYDEYCNVEELKGVITMYDYAWCVNQKYNNKPYVTPLFIENEFGDLSKIEVIGNIYENPELIK